MSNFDKYWKKSSNIKDIDEILEQILDRLDRPRTRRLINAIGNRTWIAATNKIRKDFDIVWAESKWRIKGKILETRRTKARKEPPRIRSVI